MLALHLAAAFALAPQVPADLARGPRPVVADLFHPERDSKPLRAGEPHDGGRVVIHVASAPPSLNAMIEPSATARNLLFELHEGLLRRDWETWRFRTVLAESMRVEDQIVLRASDGAGEGERVLGEAELAGEEWVVRREGEPEPRRVAASDVARVERDTVFTFHLRRDVRWHDGHPFDARDVLFSYECLRNPHVRCDRRRYLFEKIASAEMLDRHTLRFVFERQYFLAAAAFDENLTILPSHLYDLADPDNAARKAGASAEEQGRFVNENAHNRAWVGLGPYRLFEWTESHVEARRFDGYFDATARGNVDAIRWRFIPSDHAALEAVIAGEIDYYDRVSSADYFRGRTLGAAFTDTHYKGHFFAPAVSYTAWNTQRPALADARVRNALALAFDWDAFAASFYEGLAFRVTGEQLPFGASYDASLAPIPHDARRAGELLDAAGWIDRDGDGVRDREGAKLALAYLYPAGNEVSETTGEALQAALRDVGVELALDARDAAAVADALRRRDFDSAALALALDVESDPEQLWHSRWAGGASGNRSGLRDAEVDRAIEAIQRELDPAARARLLHALQRRVYELQPVLYGVCAARRFAMSKSVRNFRAYARDPGYSIREWIVVAP
jgi:peptide/nickel transport system substrate-binding protein